MEIAHTQKNPEQVEAEWAEVPARGESKGEASPVMKGDSVKGADQKIDPWHQMRGIAEGAEGLVVSPKVNIPGNQAVIVPRFRTSWHCSLNPRENME